MPAVMIATEAFGTLVKVSLDARKLNTALAVVLEGNPEYLSEQGLHPLADRVFDAIVQRLISAKGGCEELVK